MDNEALWLKQGQSDLIKITQGVKHSYQLKLIKGQFIAGTVFQKNVDVIITIKNPNGTLIGTFDQFTHNKEPFHFKTKHSGIYQIHVKPSAKDEGLYSISMNYSSPIAVTREEKMQQMMIHYAADEPGGVVTVVKGGEIVFSQSYGLANVEYDIPIEANTHFQLASASKPFTAFAIVMLAEQNKLSLDDDIRKHLSWMPDFGEVITLRHLLNHSSGLKDALNLWEMSGGRHDDILTQQQILEFIKNQRQLNFIPGQSFQYNNSAYALLAEVVSKVSRQQFNHWMTQNIFKPLGMNSTFVLDNYHQIIKKRAYSYESKYLGLKNTLSNKSFFGAVNVYSTAADLSLWLSNLHKTEIGSQNIIKSMWKPSASIFNKGKTKNYSLGVFIKQHNGLKQILQGGTTANFRTMMNYYPQIDAGVIVLSNTPDFHIKSIAHKTAEIFFSDAMLFENDSIIQTQIPGAKVRRHGITPLEKIVLKQQKLTAINDYVGTYFSEELMTTYKVEIKNKTLVVKYQRGIFPLNPKGKDRFGLNDDWLFDWDLFFQRDEQGSVQYLRLDHRRAQNVRFKRIQ